MTCPFCNILNSDTKWILRQTAHTFTILSNPRLMPGHLLVIPKKHVEKFSELSAAERTELFEEMIAIEEKILAALGSGGGCDVSQHFRPFIPQGPLKVNHLHIHIRPRTWEDDLYQKMQKYEKGIFQPLSEGEFERFRHLLRDIV